MSGHLVSLLSLYLLWTFPLLSWLVMNRMSPPHCHFSKAYPCSRTQCKRHLFHNTFLIIQTEKILPLLYAIHYEITKIWVYGHGYFCLWLLYFLEFIICKDKTYVSCIVVSIRVPITLLRCIQGGWLIFVK